MTPKDQKQREIAINEFDGNFLVSAGAGCGKTSVLTSRILNLISKKYPQNPDILSNLLVLTFTNKAAGEMKSRIRELIINDENLNHLVSDVESADITTYDAFALSLVKKYHHLIGIRGTVKIGDASVFGVKLYEIIDSILDEKYSEANINTDSTFGKLIKYYCVDNDKRILKFIHHIIDFSSSKIEGIDWFINNENKFYDDKYIDEKINEVYEYIKATLKEAFDLCKFYEDDAEKLSEKIKDYINNALKTNSYDQICSYLALPTPKAGRGLGEVSKNNHEKIKNLLKKAKSLTDSSGANSVKENYKFKKEFIDELLSIASRAQKELIDYKNKYSIYDFSDIFKFAYNLVKDNEEIRESLRSKYKYILIDEYQDTNDIQEAFINLISDNNVFQVGDIKQAIYGFRGGNCELFANKYEKYLRHDGGTLLTLSENFRTRKSVIDDFNEIFSKLMINGLGGCTYKNQHELGHGATNFDCTEHNENYASELFTYNHDKKLKQDIEEACIIANDIAEKVSKGFKVTYKDVNGNFIERQCQYDDFAILMKTKTPIVSFQKVFNEMGIPLDCPDRTNFEEKDCLIVLLNICRLISNLSKNQCNSQTKLLISSILRSFLFCLDDSELYKIITEENYSSLDFYKSIILNKNELINMSIVDCLKWIIDEFNFYDRLTILGDIKVNYERIQDMLNKANTCSLLAWDLDDFIKFYDDLSKYEYEPDTVSSPKDGNSVKLMTMHASKGLEFKIVYLAHLDRRGKEDDTRWVISDKYGILLPDSESESQTIFHKFNTLTGKAEGLSEEIRLFYVACTRAKEKLIFVTPDTMPKDQSVLKFFRDFLIKAEIFPDQAIQKNTVLNKGLVVETIEDDKSIEFENFDAIPAPIVKNPYRASKELTEPIPEEILLYGTKLHRLLELIDFKKKDLSWLDDKEQKIFGKLLTLDLFKNCSSAKIFHEYSFEDEDSKLNGIIDLLLVYDDHIDIVDYKSSNIDDPLYGSQLNLYESYIKKVFKLPINKYLLSIKECRVKKID